MPSACIGRPTTSSRDAIRRSRTSIAANALVVRSPAIVARRMRDARWRSPTATPMRWRRSRMREWSPRGGGGAAVAATRHACPTASDSLEKSMPSSFIAAGRRVSAGSANSTSVSARDGEPRVLADFLLELIGRPAGVSERDQHIVRAFAVADRLENVLRRRQA